MRLSLRSLPLVAAASLTVGCNTCGGADQPTPEVNYCSQAAADYACDHDKQFAGSYPALDTIASDFIQANPTLGCGLGVALDGQILYLGGVGYTDNGAVDPACGDDITKCRWGLDSMGGVGSVSKSLTAIATMNQLQDNWVLGLDTQLGDLLPATPAALADLTLFELLSHTSGLDEIGYENGYGEEWWLKHYYPELEHPGIHPRVMWYGLKGKVVPDPELVDEPGEGNYSNAAYRMLGAVIDAYSFESNDGVGINDMTSLSEKALTSFGHGGYEAYVRNEIAHLAFDDDQRMGTACVHGKWREATLGSSYAPNFQWTGGEDDPWSASLFTPGPGIDSVGERGPSGGWMMTIGDLMRLGIGIQQRTFVNDATLAQMRTYASTTRGFDFGLGLMLQDQVFSADPTAAKNLGYGHGGNLEQGYSAFWRVIELPTGRSLGAAMMCNGDVNSGTYQATLEAMMDIVYTDFVANPTAPSPITFDESRAHCSNPLASKPDPLVVIEGVYGAKLQELWSRYLVAAGRDPVKAEAMVRRDIAAEPGGQRAIDAYDRGDYLGAADLALGFLEDLSAAERLPTTAAPVTTPPPTAAPTTTPRSTPSDSGARR